MKKLFILLITLLVFYTVYYDFNKGTLNAFKPMQENTSIPSVIKEENETKNQDNTLKEQENHSPTFKEVKVEPGSTVLSITEQLHDAPLPVSIQQLIHDFQLLNSGIKPEKIQIGKIYKFPVYYLNKN